jgi:hypothetical protein
MYHNLLILGIVAGLVLVAVVNLAWLWHWKTHLRRLRMEGPELDDEVALPPVRELMAAKKYQEACAMLEPMVNKHRPNFQALLLLAQLFHHFEKGAQAEECLITMIRIAIGDEEQLTAMRFYHELASG